MKKWISTKQVILNTISLVNMWPYTGKYATVACRNERGATERKIDVS